MSGRGLEREQLASRVWETISRIPPGKVTTYGAIAHSVGMPRGARMIGWLLHSVPEELDLPCHRVVNSQGFLSGGWNFGHPEIMRALLLEEDVPFAGEFRVAIRECLWLPEDGAGLPAANEMHDFDLIPGS